MAYYITLSSARFLVGSWIFCFFFFSSRRRHTRSKRDWSSDVCSSDLVAGIAGVVVLLSACGGADRSPFVLWWYQDQFYRPTGGIRTGMPLDSLERFWIQRDGLRENAKVWDRCAPVDAGARRCERETVTPPGRLDVVASADG